MASADLVGSSGPQKRVGDGARSFLNKGHSSVEIGFMESLNPVLYQGTNSSLGTGGVASSSGAGEGCLESSRGEEVFVDDPCCLVGDSGLETGSKGHVSVLDGSLSQGAMGGGSNGERAMDSIGRGCVSGFVGRGRSRLVYGATCDPTNLRPGR